MKLKHILLFLIIFLFSATFAQVNPESCNLSRITKEDGLADNHVECILQDSDGFIWFGTRNGLCRYDGYEFKIFKLSREKSSISGNWILSLEEDEQGNIWIGTHNNGLNKYHKETEKFTVYNNSYGFGNRINNITVLQDSSVWVCTDYGLANYLPEQDSFEVYLPDEEKPKQLNSTHIFDLIQTKNGSCYLSTWGPDIQLFDPVSEQFTNIPYERAPELNDDYRKHIVEDNNGKLWISATKHGLCRLDPESGNSQLFTNVPGELNTDLLRGEMLVDPQGDIWIATDGMGINIYHQESKSFSYLSTNSEFGNRLPCDQVYSFLLDNEKKIWIGFFNKGVALFDPMLSKFSNSLFSPADLDVLENKSVLEIFQDSRKRIWMGTDGDGLFMFQSNRPYTHYTNDPGNNNSISSNVITSIGEDQNGNILAGTYAAGLNSINTKTDRIELFNVSNDTKVVHSSNIWDIYIDSEDRIWLGLLGNGLDLFDPKEKTFKNFGPLSSELNRVNHPNIMTITEDTDGDIWFGTEGGGVFILDGQTSKMTQMNTQEENSFLQYLMVKSFYQDSKGQMWIGTEGDGVYIFNKKNGSIRQLTIENGLPDMFVLGILEDEQQYIWLSTGNGLTRYSPQDQEFVKFSTADGLSGNEFNADAFLMLNDGRMLVGSTNGVDVFRPENINLNQNIPKVVLTKIEILNKEINKGDTINNRILLEKQISYTEEITLKQSDKIISIEFAALNFTLPGKCKYEYRLIGFESNWIPTSSSRRMATYSNLKTGSYIFEVRASNNDGKWGNNISQLKITVLPPFWATWWFVLIIAIFILFIIYLIYRNRLNAYKNKFLQQQIAHEKQIVELENEHLEFELKKLTFFRLSRNRVLLDLKMRLEGMCVKARESNKIGLEKVIDEIDKEIFSEKDWKHIEPQLDQTYNNFMTKLREKHGDLSVSEIRIAAYVRMDLTNKEMSEYMHKTLRAVENDRYRLRKKLNLDSNDSLQSYLMSFD